MDQQKESTRVLSVYIYIYREREIERDRETERGSTYIRIVKMAIFQNQESLLWMFDMIIHI